MATGAQSRLVVCSAVEVTPPVAGQRPVAPLRSSPAATARRAACAPELAPAEAGGGPREGDDHGLAGGTAVIGCLHAVPPAFAGAGYCARARFFWNIRKRHANWIMPRGPLAHGLVPWGTRALPAPCSCQGQAWPAPSLAVARRSHPANRSGRPPGPAPGSGAWPARGQAPRATAFRSRKLRDRIS